MEQLNKAIGKTCNQEKADSLVFKYEEILDKLARSLTNSEGNLVNKDLSRADILAQQIVDLSNVTSSNPEQLRHIKELVVMLESKLERIRYSLGISKELVEPDKKWIDQEKDKSPIPHNPALHKALKYSPLDRAIVKEFDEAAEFLLSEYPGLINFNAVQSYLRTKQVDTPNDLTKVGLFMITEHPTGSKRYSCQLWNWSDSLSFIKSGNLQRAQVKVLVQQHLLRHIFENPDDFFIKKPSLTTSIRQRWPWLAQYF